MQNTRLALNLEALSKIANGAFVAIAIAGFALGHYVAPWFYLLGAAFSLVVLMNIYWRFIQKKHALLANFGLLALFRYMAESIGPEFRQYFYSSDTEERPFDRNQRSEIYRLSKKVDSAASFGSQFDYTMEETKLLHSFYPTEKEDLKPFSVTFGEHRGIESTYEVDKPIMISAMSFGSLGKNAVRALSLGAKRAGIPLNTGEGGYPKYHLQEGADLIFQMGTAKFGVCNEDGSFSPDRLAEISNLEQVKMIEVKFSQGAKPGKGGLLPKEKITAEISQLRGVPMAQDVVSPSFHAECVDPQSTMRFIARVQEVSRLPVGMKFCLGRTHEFKELVAEMKRSNIFPDFVAIDGGEGGTGAAPKSFMDHVGLPLLQALPQVNDILVDAGIRDRLHVAAAGKLINAGRQVKALSLGADICYSARGFILALGCIQALQCNRNNCPVGITTHRADLQHGLDIELKAERVKNYVAGLCKEHRELWSAMGCVEASKLGRQNIHVPNAPQLKL